MLLRAENLTVERGGRAIVDGVDLEVGRGELVGLIGPNGAGKTTLLKAMIGVTAASGAVFLQDSPLEKLSANERARRVAFLPQDHEIAWPVKVREVVALGRQPWRQGSCFGDYARGQIIAEAMARMGVEGFAERTADTLSGGERARVLIARALAQMTPLLIADEPVAGLEDEALLLALFWYPACLPCPGIWLACCDADRALDERDGNRVLICVDIKFRAERACDCAARFDEERPVGMFDLEQGFAFSEVDAAFGFGIADAERRVCVEREDGSILEGDGLLLADCGRIGERSRVWFWGLERESGGADDECRGCGGQGQEDGFAAPARVSGCGTTETGPVKESEQGFDLPVSGRIGWVLFPFEESFPGVWADVRVLQLCVPERGGLPPLGLVLLVRHRLAHSPFAGDRFAVPERFSAISAIASAMSVLTVVGETDKRRAISS